MDDNKALSEMVDNKWWSRDPGNADAIPLGPFAVRYAVWLMHIEGQSSEQVNVQLETMQLAARKKRGPNSPKEHLGGATDAGGTPAGLAPT